MSWLSRITDSLLSPTPSPRSSVVEDSDDWENMHTPRDSQEPERAPTQHRSRLSHPVGRSSSSSGSGVLVPSHGTHHRQTRFSGSGTGYNRNRNDQGRHMSNNQSQRTRTTLPGTSVPQTRLPRPLPSLSGPPIIMGKHSSPAIPDGLYYADNFMLGVGMLIIQPATAKVVLVNDTRQPNYWFLPKGRKDIGESMEDAAIREAYEESGFRATLMPLFTPTHAPHSPTDTRRGIERHLNTEPIYISTHFWPPSRGRPEAGIYFTHWYVGEIPEDAERQAGTGMADEQNYVAHLVDYEDACNKLSGILFEVFDMGCRTWMRTVEALSRESERQAGREEASQVSA